MMGKFMSWVFLFHTFYFVLKALLWQWSEWAWNSTYPAMYCICALIFGILTTVLSPREPIYDLARYLSLAVLAGISCHVSFSATVVLVFLAFLLYPSVAADLKGLGAAKREKTMHYAKFVGLAVLLGLSQQEPHETVQEGTLHQWRRKRAAEKLAEQKRREALDREMEFFVGISDW